MNGAFIHCKPEIELELKVNGAAYISWSPHYYLKHIKSYMEKITSLGSMENKKK